MLVLSRRPSEKILFPTLGTSVQVVTMVREYLPALHELARGRHHVTALGAEAVTIAPVLLATRRSWCAWTGLASRRSSGCELWRPTTLGVPRAVVSSPPGRRAAGGGTR